MEYGIAKQTREVVKLELAGLILADLLRLGTILGGSAGFRALALPVPAIPGRVELTLNSMPYELKLEDIDVDQYPIGHIVMAMYEYAYEYNYPIGIQMYQFKAEMEHVEDFVFNLKSEYIGLFMRDQSLMGSAADAQWTALPELYTIARARLDLDMGESLTISDIAALAGMQEKSVRNALTATGDGQLNLHICPDYASHLEFVDNDEARRWLSLRRGFVPTNFKEMSAVAGEHPESLNTLFELGNYIHERWTSLGKIPETVIKELDWPIGKFDYLNAITANPQNIDPKDCRDLAVSLLVSESWFTSQVMRNLFPHEVEQLLMREKEGELTTRNVSKPVNNDRICQRVKFILHDGTELYPVKMKNRQTGTVAFRLSEGGAGGNTIENTIEVADEGEMISMVCNKGMSVRLQNADGKRQGLYTKDGRSVRNVELDGVVI